MSTPANDAFQSVRSALRPNVKISAYVWNSIESHCQRGRLLRFFTIVKLRSEHSGGRNVERR